MEFPVTPTQIPFLRSNALVKGFVGGVGSGKSYAGAIDLINRAKPGRLYMVVSTTYKLLSDATFRTFLQVANRLNLIKHPTDVKKAPPQVMLATGAEILFRSADNHDNLRATNLSGVWMDEASYMEEEAYLVLLGRLRESGEQGWLTATFTPKGKRNWTYKVFGGNEPDTEIFHARTKDNIFNPETYDTNLRRRYTSAFAQQELEGLFIDAGGTLFKREWFQILDVAPTEFKSLVRAWDFAATEKADPKAGEMANDPDYTAGVLMGRTSDNQYVILDVRTLRGTPLSVEQTIRATAIEDRNNYGRVSIWAEQEPGSSGVTVIDHYLRNVLAGFNFHGERSTGDKSTRAMPLAAMAEGRNVKLLKGNFNKAFLDECEDFPVGKHDDQVDSASLAFSKISTKREFWIA
jgi:predicted phage terminase large subunit-like protein